MISRSACTESARPVASFTPTFSPSGASGRNVLCADIDGFSLHASVRCGADDRQALEQLCRYITRPALVNEWVQTDAAGQLVLKLKTVCARRHHAIGYGAAGILAATGGAGATPAAAPDSVPRRTGTNAKLRAQVVPREPETPAKEAKPAQCDASCAHHCPVRLSSGHAAQAGFEIDMEHCPNVGGEMKSTAAILEQPVIEKILTHLGLQARAPPLAPARGQALQAA